MIPAKCFDAEAGKVYVSSCSLARFNEAAGIYLWIICVIECFATGNTVSRLNLQQNKKNVLMHQITADTNHTAYSYASVFIYVVRDNNITFCYLGSLHDNY